MMFAVSLANYNNDVRHTDVGWVLVGFIPVIDKNKGTYKGANKPARRSVRLWHKCVGILTASIKEAFETSIPVLCADGLVRQVKPVVASWLGDRQEHEKICSIVQVWINKGLQWLHMF